MIEWLTTLRPESPGTSADEEALLAGMLAHYTPSGTERPLAEWLRDWLIPLGFTAEVDAVGNLVAELPATAPVGAAFRLDVEARGRSHRDAPCVLLGHLDTVPGFIPVRREGDRLYGRGAVDAKGPLAAFLAAAIRLAARRPPRGRPLVLVGAVEEEAATSRGARAVLDRWRPAYAIIGEPSGADAITLGYKGRLLVRYRIERPVAHTARPEDSVCARGVTFWTALRGQADAWNAAYVPARDGAHFLALTPSLRAIHSGSDGFTDWCELEVGYRLPPAFDLPALERWLEEIAHRDGGRVTFRGAETAYPAEQRGPLVSAFIRALRAEGLKPIFKRKTGTSDMNVVGPVWNCPILAYGPGDATLDHTPDGTSPADGVPPGDCRPGARADRSGRRAAPMGEASRLDSNEGRYPMTTFETNQQTGTAPALAIVDTTLRGASSLRARPPRT
jgi:N-acetyl-ornithine/N-acetyl-lysine deacetylase